MAPQIAKSAGIDELTARHWQVIRFMRAEYQAKGTGPTVRVLGKTSGVSIKDAVPAVPQGPGQDCREDRRDSQATRLHLTRREDGPAMDTSIGKVSIIVSKGSLEGIYPAPIMANGARAEGIEASLFFTFFGLDAISKKRHEHIKVADTGAGIYGCQASCDLFGITKDDLIEQVKDIITMGEFYALAAGGQIIFT